MVGVQTGMARCSRSSGRSAVDAGGRGLHQAKVAESFGSTRDSHARDRRHRRQGPDERLRAGQLDVAAKAKILTPQEMNSGVLAFQQYGSAYIGEQGKTPPPGRTTARGSARASSTSCCPSVFAAAKVQGVEQGAAGTIFAKIVQAMPAHSQDLRLQGRLRQGAGDGQELVRLRDPDGEEPRPRSSRRTWRGRRVRADDGGHLSATKVSPRSPRRTRGGRGLHQPDDPGL
jgi:hypothetical protein